MITPEDEEAAWTLLMMRYSVPATKPTRNSEKRPPMLLPMKQEHKKIKFMANICFEGEPYSSGTKEQMPKWLVQLIKVKDEKNLKNIIEKELTATNINSNNNRLSIPVSQIIDLEFLSPTERRIIDEQSRKISKKGVNVTLVASYQTEFPLNLRLWDMGKCPVYNLVTGWNKVVQHYRLKEKDRIHLWSFHANEKLYFALVRPSAE